MKKSFYSLALIASALTLAPSAQAIFDNEIKPLKSRGTEVTTFYYPILGELSATYATHSEKSSLDTLDFKEYNFKSGFKYIYNIESTVNPFSTLYVTTGYLLQKHNYRLANRHPGHVNSFSVLGLGLDTGLNFSPTNYFSVYTALDIQFRFALVKKNSSNISEFGSKVGITYRMDRGTHLLFELGYKFSSYSKLRQEPLKFITFSTGFLF